MDCLLDPDDIMNIIRRTMQKPALQEFLKSCDVAVQRLGVVRDWKAWHGALRVEMSGGLLVDSTALHYFLFIRRDGGPEKK